MAKQIEIHEISAELSRTLILKIPNFFALMRGNCYLVDSDTFNFASATWCCRLYPNGPFEGSSEEYVHFSLVRLHSDVRKHIINYTVLLFMDRSTVYKEYSDIYIFNENDVESDMDEYFTHSDVKFTQDGNLKLLCHLFCNELENVNILSRPASHPLVIDSRLSDDYTTLLLNGRDQNLTLKVKGRQFRVHQDILKARSHVFCSMLTHDMLEKNNGVVDISDCKPEAMEQFLYYIYSGKIHTLNKDNMLGLYYIADKYNFLHLKEVCCNFIKDELSPTIICDVIQLALSHSDSDLLESATKYFMVNVNNILATDEWLDFMKKNINIGNELLIKAFKTFNVGII